MKIAITATDQITELDGVLVRVWEGVTESGIRCHVFVHRIAVWADADNSQFERELIGGSGHRANVEFGFCGLNLTRG